MDISRQKEATPQRWRLGFWAALGLTLVAAGLLGGCRALRHQGAMPEADAVRILTATQAQTPVTTATSLPVSASTPTAIAREDKARQRQPEPTPTETVLSAGPRLEESGAYEFQAEHQGGQYYLHRTGDLVTATLKNPSGPLLPSSALFTVPAAYRPPFLIWRDVAGRVVQADGIPQPDHPEPYPFRLWIYPDGTVRQGLQAGSPEKWNLAYDLTVTWGTTPAANDQAVLAVMDENWFGMPVVSVQPSSPSTPNTAWLHLTLPPQVQAGRTITVGTRVTRNAEGRVTGLVLRDLKWGTIPSELGQLRQLSHLELTGNGQSDHGMRKYLLTQNEPLPPGLTGTIPSALGHLAQLQVLDLANNQLTGPIPPSLGQLARLEALELSHNLLTGAVPSALGRLARLRRLTLNDNWLTALPPDLGRLAGLQHLWLSENWLTALPPALGQLNSLESLVLDFNQLTTLPPELGQLVNLQHLTLHNNRLLALPPELGQLKNLTFLAASDNRLTALPPELGQLKNLTFLAAHDNRLTALPPELGQLKNLDYLGLSNNRLTALPPELGQLGQLRRLNVAGNQLTTISPALGQLGLLNKPSLNDNPLTGCLPATWLDRWPDFSVPVIADGQVVAQLWLPACPA